MIIPQRRGLGREPKIKSPRELKSLGEMIQAKSTGKEEKAEEERVSSPHTLTIEELSSLIFVLDGRDRNDIAVEEHELKAGCRIRFRHGTED